MRITGIGWGSVPVNGRGGWPGGLSLYAKPTQPASQPASQPSSGGACVPEPSLSDLLSGESEPSRESSLVAGPGALAPFADRPLPPSLTIVVALASLSPLSRQE